MLAQNFKTPADLGVDDAEFEALIKVLGMLEREEIPHENPVIKPGIGPPADGPTGFNLAHWRCGTAACIGGWVETVGNIRLGHRCRHGHSLHPLFFPDSYDVPADLTFMRAVTPSQAAIALRNYLTHGEPRWAEALAE